MAPAELQLLPQPKTAATLQYLLIQSLLSAADMGPLQTAPPAGLEDRAEEAQVEEVAPAVLVLLVKETPAEQEAPHSGRLLAVAGEQTVLAALEGQTQALEGLVAHLQ